MDSGDGGAVEEIAFRQSQARPLISSLNQCCPVELGAGDPAELGVFGFDSIDVRSRSFNLIRAKLMQIHQRRGWRMVGIVSATPHVGKSFIAANVAASLSRDPRCQTYLLDLDLRRASLTSLPRVSGRGGLRDYLEGSEQAPVPISCSFIGQKLIFLPTSPGSVHSAELIANERAGRLFAAMRKSARTNLFLVDLPPIFANDDANNCLSAMDGYILVAEEGKTTQRQIKDAIQLVGTDRLAGVILNKYRGGMVSEGYGMEGYYASGYGQTD